MAETKDKIVTVESLDALHKYNQESYMVNNNPSATGSLSLNRRADTTISQGSVALGGNTVAQAVFSVALGNSTEAHSAYSYAEGLCNIAKCPCQHVQGRYNIVDEDKKFAHIVGNGTKEDGVEKRSNAHTVDWEGNAWYAGSVEASCFILKSSTENSTKKFKITVDDTGVLTATEITEI